MRIFFASTIGFQVPVTQFRSGDVIWKGLLFTLALLGKLVVGFLVPNFTQEKKFTGNHLRDCLIVGCSMVRKIDLYRHDHITIFFVSKLLQRNTFKNLILVVVVFSIVCHVGFCLYT